MRLACVCVQCLQRLRSICLQRTSREPERRDCSSGLRGRTSKRAARCPAWQAREIYACPMPLQAPKRAAWIDRVTANVDFGVQRTLLVRGTPKSSSFFVAEKPPLISMMFRINPKSTFLASGVHGRRVLADLQWFAAEWLQRGKANSRRAGFFA